MGHVCLLVGRITAFKEDLPGQHTMSFQCKIHKNCKVLKLYKKLPDGFFVTGQTYCLFLFILYYVVMIYII